MKFHLKLRFAILVATASALVLGLVGVSASAASQPSGTITYAEAPGAAPDWIFPYTGYQAFSASNINQFQQLMFRPLYFFGLGSTSAYVPSLSLAETPVLTNNNKTIILNLKGWRFADGQIVNAESVMFFLNLYEADPTGYGGYTPGVGIPDQVAGVSGSGLRVVIHMKVSVNPNWLLYNYLSEITPLPTSWDVTAAHAKGSCASGAYGAASTTASCKAVEAYLDKLAVATNTFAAGFWQGGVDGPWRLTSFDSAGDATFQPNRAYSGPQHAQVRYVKEIAYGSEATELADLQAGKLDLGYVDPSDLTSPAPSPGKAGANLGSLNAHYRLSVVTPYGFDFAQMNYSASNPLSAVFNQLYFRQALEESFNQTSVVRSADDNYGVPAFSPLPLGAPPTIAKPPTNPYAFNYAAAKALLTSHGWSEVNGVMTCSSPGTTASGCGANVAAGTQLSFSIMYATGSPSIDLSVNALVADWAAIGIDATASANTFNNLASSCTVGSGTPWSICWSGESWTYDPNFYPSGDQTLLSGASSNWGGYNNAQMNALIVADTQGKTSLSAFEQYAADQVPVLYMPNLENLVEINRRLVSSLGFSANPLRNFLPEYMRV
ncbi:MAG: extracellular solute-binding protein family 5 [Acidimicrobiaceae bacterium]|nr:extracellular solute-binding protein family 5 [Acidimicrobiaceae bacterium]